MPPLLAALSMGAAFAASGGGPGVAGRSVPLYDFDGRCADPRLPALAGPWVVGCGVEGRVDRVLDLRTGRRFDLDPPLDRPGLGPSALVQVGMDTRVVRLTADGPVEVEGVTRLVDRAAGPPATDGAHLALLSEDAVQALATDQRGRRKHETRAAGWYGVAMTWPWVAWVADGWTDGEDVWALDLSADRPRPAPLAAGPGHQRHVVAHAGWLAWVEPGAVVLHHPEDGRWRRVPAQTGFHAPPTLWEGVVCWEERGPTDIDLRCSDGVAAAGPGDQLWPSRWDRWLLYRQGDLLLLHTAAP